MKPGNDFGRAGLFCLWGAHALAEGSQAAQIRPSRSLSKFPAADHGASSSRAVSLRKATYSCRIAGGPRRICDWHSS
jgi:hypothetical protein